MARFKSSAAVDDSSRHYLEGVAKHLVERLYGEKGPAWGTKLTEIEDTILALRQVLSEEFLDQALQRQAQMSSERPAELKGCPKCGKEVQDRRKENDDRRTLQTRVGQAQWQEPETYCRSCRRSFFPSDQESGD